MRHRPSITVQDVKYVRRLLMKERHFPQSWFQSTENGHCGVHFRSDGKPDSVEGCPKCERFVFEKLNDALCDGRWGKKLDFRKNKSGRKIYFFKKRRRVGKILDKLIARKIKNAFRLRVMDRDSAIFQLCDALQLSPRGKRNVEGSAVLRCDIRSFFESVDQTHVIQLLRTNPALDEYVLDYLEEIWEESNKRNSGSTKGLPTGLATSNVLAELVMRNVDLKFLAHEAISAYVRYVDDIVIVCKQDTYETVKTLFRQELSLLGLSLNDAKTVDIANGNSQRQFDYLGYRFSLTERWELLPLDISHDKCERYLREIQRFADCVRKDSKLTAYDLAMSYAGLLYPANIRPKRASACPSNRQKTGLAISAAMCLNQSFFQKQLIKHDCLISSRSHYCAPENIKSICDAARSELFACYSSTKRCLNQADRKFVRLVLRSLTCDGHIITMPAIDLPKRAGQVRAKGKL